MFFLSSDRSCLMTPPNSLAGPTPEHCGRSHLPDLQSSCGWRRQDPPQTPTERKEQSADPKPTVSMRSTYCTLYFDYISCEYEYSYGGGIRYSYVLFIPYGV